MPLNIARDRFHAVRRAELQQQHRHIEMRTAFAAYRMEFATVSPLTLSTDSETPMPANVPKPKEMLPIDNDDHTWEVDMRWLLTDRPEFKELVESSSAEPEYEESTDYEDPRLGSELTETQVLELLNSGKK